MYEDNVTGCACGHLRTWMNLTEAGEYAAGVSRQTMRLLLDEYAIPHIQRGRVYMISPRELDAALTRQAQAQVSA